jgi:hypothetical protein
LKNTVQQTEPARCGIFEMKPMLVYRMCSFLRVCAVTVYISVQIFEVVREQARCALLYTLGQVEAGRPAPRLLTSPRAIPSLHTGCVSLKMGKQRFRPRCQAMTPEEEARAYSGVSVPTTELLPSARPRRDSSPADFFVGVVGSVASLVGINLTKPRVKERPSIPNEPDFEAPCPLTSVGNPKGPESSTSYASTRREAEIDGDKTAIFGEASINHCFAVPQSHALEASCQYGGDETSIFCEASMDQTSTFDPYASVLPAEAPRYPVICRMSPQIHRSNTRNYASKVSEPQPNSPQIVYCANGIQQPSRTRNRRSSTFRPIDLETTVLESVLEHAPMVACLNLSDLQADNVRPSLCLPVPDEPFLIDDLQSDNRYFHQSWRATAILSLFLNMHSSMRPTCSALMPALFPRLTAASCHVPMHP